MKFVFSSTFLAPVSLGQATPPPGEIIGLLAWIVGLAVAAAVLLFFVRLWFKNQEEDTNATVGFGFSLADLREMREQGQIDAEEFETAKARMIGRANAAAETESDASVSADRLPEGEASPSVKRIDSGIPDDFFIEPVEENPEDGKDPEGEDEGSGGLDKAEA